MRSLSRLGSIASIFFGTLTAFCVTVTLVVMATSPQAPAVRDLTVRQTSGGWSFNSAERCFMKKINNIRARHGLGPASSDPQLGYELMSRFAQVMIRRLQWTRLRLLDVYGDGHRS